MQLVNDDDNYVYDDVVLLHLQLLPGRLSPTSKVSKIKVLGSWWSQSGGTSRAEGIRFFQMRFRQI